MSFGWRSSRMTRPSWWSSSRRSSQGEDRANTSTGRHPGDAVEARIRLLGHGPAMVGDGRELLAQEPVYRRAIEEVSDLFGRLAGWSLLDKLMAEEQARRSSRPDVGQPAIFALQVALAALWRSWGVEPAAVLGS